MFVLRWSHLGASLESVGYEYDLTRFLQARIPQVLTPLTNREGFPCMLYEGRVVTLFPFLNGRQADRESPTLRANAACMLARLHRESCSFPSEGFRPGYPSLRELDWDRNPLWDWNRVSALLRQTSPVRSVDDTIKAKDESPCFAAILGRTEQIEREWVTFRAWIGHLAASGRSLSWGPIHGDYYRANLLTEQDEITGVLDWEECRPEWLAWELGRALWEFCKDEVTSTLNHERARVFLHAYQEAQGPVSPAEFDLLIPFIRCVRLTEVLWDLDRAVQGQEWSPQYTLHNLLALENLETSQPLNEITP